MRQEFMRIKAYAIHIIDRNACKSQLYFGKILETHGNTVAACLKYGICIDLTLRRVCFQFWLPCGTQPAIAISKPGKNSSRRVSVFGVFKYLIEFLK